MNVKARLRAIEPLDNSYREYELETRPVDGGGFRLITRRGRIGQSLRTRESHFNTPRSLAEEVGRLLRLRIAHGYILAR